MKEYCLSILYFACFPKWYDNGEALKVGLNFSSHIDQSLFR